MSRCIHDTFTGPRDAKVPVLLFIPLWRPRFQRRKSTATDAA